jgi:hypothetical protein
MKLPNPFQRKTRPPRTVLARRDARGEVDWDAVPAGAAVRMRVNHEGHTLHGSSVLVLKRPDGTLAVASPDGSRQYPIPPPVPAPPDPARGVPEEQLAARAAQLRAALDRLYGLTAPEERGWAEAATRFAREAGLDELRAAFFGHFVAEQLAHISRARQAELAQLQHVRAAETLAQAWNAGRRERERRGRERERLQAELPYYRPGDGLHLQDGPLSYRDTRRLLAEAKRGETDPLRLLAAPLSFVITRADVRALRNAPLQALQQRVDRLLTLQEQTEDGLHQEPLLDPFDPRLERDPAEGPEPFREPNPVRTLVLRTQAHALQEMRNLDVARGALTLHARHDALALKAAGRMAEPPPLPIDPRLVEASADDAEAGALLLQSCADPAFLWTAAADVVAAADAAWQDEDALYDRGGMMGGFLGAAVSRGAAAALAYLQPTPDPGRLARELPPAALARLYAREGVDEERLALLSAALPEVEASVLAENRPLWRELGGDPLAAARALAALRDGTGIALGLVQTATALAWAVARGGGDEREAVELRAGDNVRAAQALRRQLQHGSGGDAAPAVYHDGGQTVLRTDLATLAGFQAQLEATLAHEADLDEQRDEPVAWLAAAGGGVLSARSEDDFALALGLAIQAKLLEDPGFRCLVLVPKGLLATAARELAAVAALPPQRVVALGEGPVSVRQATAARIILASYRTAYENLDIMTAFRLSGLVLVEPPLLSWQRGGGIAQPLRSLMALDAPWRVVVTAHGLLDNPLRMYDLVAWAERGRDFHYQGDEGRVRYVTLLPDRHAAWGLQAGVGTGTAAERFAVQAAFAPLLASMVLEPQPRRPLRYAERRVPVGAATRAALRAALTEAGRGGARPRVAAGETKAFARLDRQARLRPRLDAAAWRALYGAADAAVYDRLVAALTGGGHAVVVSARDGGVQRRALRARLRGRRLLEAGEADALRRLADGEGEVIVGSAQEFLRPPGDGAAERELAAIHTLHVLADPQAAAAVVLAVAAAGDEPLSVVGYPYAGEWAGGNWHHLRLAAQAARQAAAAE